MGKRPSGVSSARILAGSVLASILLTTAACGGDGEAAPKPLPESSAPTPSESVTPSESPSPSPTPTTKPLSRFEDEPPVQAARRWASRTARAVNERDRDMSGLRPILTAHGADVLPTLTAEDMGFYYPGPVPFTPTGVETDGRTARVVGCYWVQGFALESKGGLPGRERQIAPGVLVFKKSKGEWLFNDFLEHDNSCKNVPVKGIGW